MHEVNTTRRWTWNLGSKCVLAAAMQEMASVVIQINTCITERVVQNAGDWTDETYGFLRRGKIG